VGVVKCGNSQVSHMGPITSGGYRSNRMKFSKIFFTSKADILGAVCGFSPVYRVAEDCRVERPKKSEKNSLSLVGICGKFWGVVVGICTHALLY